MGVGESGGLLGLAQAFGFFGRCVMKSAEFANFFNVEVNAGHVVEFAPNAVGIIGQHVKAFVDQITLAV